MPITFDITTDKLYNQGIKEGERRGEQKGKLTIAELMIREGESAEKIARFTGLSMPELELLRREKGR